MEESKPMPKSIVLVIALDLRSNWIHGVGGRLSVAEVNQGAVENDD